MNTTKKIQYDRNKPFNELPLLPTDDKIFDGEVLLKWGHASRALAELNRNVMRLPNPLMLINTLALQEARSSTEIENIFTTEDDLYKAISETVKEEQARGSVKEVLRYRESLWAGYRTIQKSGKLDEKAIIQVFKQIKNLSQTYRSPQSMVVIKRGNSEVKPGETIYTPPRGKGVIETKMKNLISYLNDEKKYPVDPLLKMAIAHYQFEAIHPFIDGNGRTGRVINLLYLVNQQLLAQPVLYLSKYIIEHKEDYYHLLAGVTQRQAWKPWLMYMLDAVEQSAKHSNRIIDEILEQMESTLAHGKKHLKTYSKELNELLFSQPYTKAKSVGEVLGKSSRTTITKYMADLVKNGILTPKIDGKEVYYMNHDLLRILNG
ncbi:MAG: Fic/DOC family N-terminal domain-containing protein [Bacteroidota bacterium]